MIKFFIKKKNLEKGFTLVETLIAISIFSISLVSLMVILGRGISDTGYARKKEVAAYLAQEGVEYMRNLRDTYVINTASAQTGWNNFNNNLIDTSACQQANGCYFDADNIFSLSPPMPITQMAITACGTNCPVLLYDSATGKFGYVPSGTTTSSGFTRKITISPASPVNETRISSTVYWTQGSGNYNLTFSENLSNWIE